MQCVDCGSLENVSLCQGDLDLCPACEEKRFPDIATLWGENPTKWRASLKKSKKKSTFLAAQLVEVSL